MKTICAKLQILTSVLLHNFYKASGISYSIFRRFLASNDRTISEKIIPKLWNIYFSLFLNVIEFGVLFESKYFTAYFSHFFSVAHLCLFLFCKNFCIRNFSLFSINIVKYFTARERSFAVYHFSKLPGHWLFIDINYLTML